MPAVDISKAFDIHVHSAPSLFDRMGDDLYMARHAADTGMAGLLLKSHFESTVGRAYLADKLTENVRIFGGLVLNNFAGGLNPVAVEASLNLGAKQIWMPTIEAKAHGDAFGHLGGFGYMESGMSVERKGISVFDASGELLPSVKLIMELMRDADVILGTGHLAAAEVLAMCRLAKDLSFGKLVVTHPYFTCPNLNLDQQKEAVALGATLEICGGNLYPLPGVGRLSKYLETVKEIGAAHLVMSSDTGQRRKSTPHEVLRIFCQCLMDEGVSQADIDLMCKENPCRLLNL